MASSNVVFGFVSDVAGKSTQSPNTGQLTKPFLSNPTVLNETELSFAPWSLAMTGGGIAWMHELCDTSLCSMYQNNVIRELSTTGSLVNISVHPHTDVLYCLLSDDSINTVDRTNGNLTKLFDTKGRNLSIAITKDGNLLVGDDSEPVVTLYTEVSSCRPLHTKDSDHVIYQYVCPQGWWHYHLEDQVSWYWTAI